MPVIQRPFEAAGERAVGEPYPRRTAARSGAPGNWAYEEYLQEKDAYKGERRDRHARAITVTALLAVAFGLVLTLLVASGLRAPLQVAVPIGGLVTVTWMLVGARRFYATVPEIEAWRRAATAQRRTARVLGQLRRSGYAVLHDRTIPGAARVLHHLVVGPSGVHVLTDHPGSGELRYHPDGVWLQSVPLRGILANTAALADEVTRQLAEVTPRPAVEPILVAVDATVLWRDGAVDGVTVLGLRDLVPHVLHARPRLTASQVAHLAQTANRLFPPAASRADHTVTIDGAECAALTGLLREIKDRGGDARPVLSELGRLADYLDGRRYASSPTDSATRGSGSRRRSSRWRTQALASSTTSTSGVRRRAYRRI
ncbi:MULTISPECIES: nuclease-related domain-containing protein [unclassified Pseudofrankia]|uniref:nuclease-related domain-containing protein n=1 Tax=unclassified Pseudofrankia TaxID=2994372 RepID=UPI0008DAAE42|nr:MULTISPECIES: nuclease-related domain-containing protein [unclassified Pseudofrankia]MDT3442529.1 nuclease-related domain-containing protein [Pseudofrankia sp. BMG5.37]OHV74688.1 hypothetical protein BCD48_31560 [Pseudofrankia sp. BMG5.36]